MQIKLKKTDDGWRSKSTFGGIFVQTTNRWRAAVWADLKPIKCVICDTDAGFFLRPGALAVYFPSSSDLCRSADVFISFKAPLGNRLLKDTSGLCWELANREGENLPTYLAVALHTDWWVMERQNKLLSIDSEKLEVDKARPKSKTRIYPMVLHLTN